MKVGNAINAFLVNMTIKRTKTVWLKNKIDRIGKSKRRQYDFEWMSV